MQQVYTAQHPAEAHLVKGLLEASGVHCEVRGEALWGTRGMVPVTVETAPSVWIFDDADVDTAKTVIDRYEDNIPADSSNEGTWICSSCGEPSEEQFTQCWNCGTERH